MTTIYKVADQENITPTLEHVEKQVVANAGSTEKLATSLDESSLADEMDKVEKCATTGSNYAYNEGWQPDQVSQLREYAAVVGLKGKMVAVKPSGPEKESKVSDDLQMKHLSAAIDANKPQVSAQLSMAVGDPFRLTDANDAPSAKDNWQKVTPERKLASAPSISSRSGSISSIRGEYEFESSPTLRVRRGENSLCNPDAIGALAKEQDTGERLKAEIATAKVERKAAKTVWQKDVVQQAKNMGAGSLPRGKVFMTGSIPEREKVSGLDLKQASEELSKVEELALPDLTGGEQLHGINAGRRSEIQRKAEKDNWQTVKGTTRPGLSDDFAEALERQMKNAGIKI